MEKFFNEKCGLLYWNADLMWTFLSKKVHMWTFGAKCGPIWQHCTVLCSMYKVLILPEILNNPTL